MKADVHYETVDAAAFLRENPVLPYNIIVFPKSISEFPEDVFKTILDCFTSAKFQFKGKDGQPRNIQRVHFLVSLRIKKGVAPDELMDTKRSDRLIEAMVKNGFALENSAKVEQGAAGEICIYEQEDGFDYPMEAMNFMKKLSNEDIKIPMLHTRYVCNRIMSFVRKG